VLTLYYGSGSMGFSVGPASIEKTEWNKLRTATARLLTARGFQKAADVLTRYPFLIHVGENDFNDDFSVLYAEVGLPVYVEIEEIHRAPGGRKLFAVIANTINELGHYIRFVAIDLALDDAPDPVANPNPAFTTEVAERALFDAEQLLSTSGPISAVDRVHTALHGYLREICLRLKGISTQPLASLDVTALFKVLRTTTVFGQSAHSQHAEKLAQGLAVTIDALNPLRNQGSMAHPNPVLLTEAEAMLAINSARTILHYVDTTVSPPSKSKPEDPDLDAEPEWWSLFR
jgi:abortive infection Abi-like protein